MHLTEINGRWRICNQHLELIHPNGFERHPSALLEAFVLLAQNPELKGLRASTTRQMYTARHHDDASEIVWYVSYWSSCVTPKNCLKYSSRYALRDPESLYSNLKSWQCMTCFIFTQRCAHVTIGTSHTGVLRRLPAQVD